jgi:hypothetical protein
MAASGNGAKRVIRWKSHARSHIVTPSQFNISVSEFPNGLSFWAREGLHPIGISEKIQ